MTETPTTSSTNSTKVGYLFGLGILLVPIIFVWGLLKPGYSTLARVLGFAWLALFLIVVFTSHNTGTKPSSNIENKKRVAVSSATNAVPQSENKNTETKTASSSAPTPPPPKPESKWTYSEDSDQMRGTKSHFATLESENELSFGFPYSGGKAKLIVRRRPEDGLNVMLNISGQFMCSSFSHSTVAVKFDRRPIQNFSCSEPSDSSTGWLFIGNAKRFVVELKQSKSVVIEAEFYQQGRRQMQFDVSGLEWN